MQYSQFLNKAPQCIDCGLKTKLYKHRKSKLTPTVISNLNIGFYHMNRGKLFFNNRNAIYFTMYQNGRQQNYVWSVDCVIVSFSHDLRWQFDLNPSHIYYPQSTPTGLFSDSFRMEISYLMNFNVLQKLQRILLQITPCPFIAR